MGRSLRTVHKYRDTVTVGYGNHLLHGVDSAKHVAYMSKRSEYRTLVEQRPILFQIKFPPVVYVHHPDFNVVMTLKELPGHNIGMMLHYGEDNLVSVSEAVSV